MRGWILSGLATVLFGVALITPSNGLRNLQFLAPGGTSRTAYSKMSDVVSVCDFIGSTCPSGGDDTAAIQAAYTANPTGQIYFPCGTYNISSPISLSSSFNGTKFEGANAYCVTIIATQAMAAMFQFTDISSNGGFEFREMLLNGNHLAAKGIVSTQLRYIRIDRMRIVGTTTAAVDLSQGWDQNITNSFFQNNDGDALRLGANANNVQVRGNVISTQPGWGILVTWGLGVNISNNDISANELGGIYIVSGSGTAGAGVVNVKDNYFEGNAAHSTSTAVTFTNGSAVITGVSAADVAIALANVGKGISTAASGVPVPSLTTISGAGGSTITMSANANSSVSAFAYIAVGVTLSATAMTADVLLNGSADATLLSNSFPIAAASIEGNTTTSNGSASMIYYDPGVAQSIRAINNSHTVYSSRSQSLVTGVGAFGATPAMNLEGNQGFTANNGNGRRLHDRSNLAPNGGTVTISLGVGEEFIITPSTTTAYTVAFPTGSLGTNNHPAFQYVVIRVVNTTGGALSGTTWAAGYSLAGAWVDPADGTNRSITFSCDSFTTIRCYEISRSAANVTN